MENRELILQKISEMTPSLIYLCNIEKSKTAYLNKTALNMIGVSSADVEKESVFFGGAIHPEDLSLVQEHHNRLGLSKDGEISTVEFRIKEKEDGWRWLSSKETVFSRNELGGVKEILGVAQDITDAKISSQLLHKSEEMFKLVFDQSPIGAAVLNMDMQFVRINESLCQMLGYEESELLFKKFTEITHPENVEKDVENVKKLITGEIDLYKTEKKYLTKDKKIIEARVAVRLIKDTEGKPLYFLPLIENITEQKETKKALIGAEEFIEKLLKTTNAIVVELNNDGKIVRFSGAAEELTGYKESEVVGQSWFDLFIPSDRFPEVRKEFDRLFKGGIPKSFENPIQAKNGDEKYVSWRNSQLYDNGKLIGTLSFGIDITEHKRYEDEAKKQMETVERLNQLLLGRESRMAELKDEIEKLKKNKS